MMMAGHNSHRNRNTRSSKNNMNCQRPSSLIVVTMMVLMSSDHWFVRTKSVHAFSLSSPQRSTGHARTIGPSLALSALSTSTKSLKDCADDELSVLFSEGDVTTNDSDTHTTLSRRDWILSTSRKASMAVAAAATTTTMVDPTREAFAASGDDIQKTQPEPSQEGLLSESRVGDILRTVPTFTIVDKSGVPFMVVGEDAKVTGYFFIAYPEAERVLNLAKSSSEKVVQEALKELRDKRKADGLPKLKADEELREAGVVNPWTDARISTVNLDFAVSLASSRSVGNNYFKVAAAVDDIDDALSVTGKQSLAEGKVPLFYFRDFQVENEKDGTKRSPLYFRKSELIADYRKQNSGKRVPEVLVSELFRVVLELVKPGGTDEELKTVVVVPPKESVAKAEQCQKAMGDAIPFQLGARNLVL